MLDLAIAEGAGGEAEADDPQGDNEALAADRLAEITEPFVPQGSGRSVSTAAPITASNLDPNAKEFLHSSKIRAKLLGDPTYLQTLMSPQSSEQVADLLEAGDEEVRGIVLAGVMPNARLFMKTEEGAKEFVALVSRPELQLGNLGNILNVVLGEPQQFDDQYWVTSLEALITAVAQRGFPDLRTRLVHFLQDENMMNRARGGQVLAHCLTTMPYEEIKALIRHALDTINDKLKSEFGSRCLSICFRNAQADEVQDFNKCSLLWISGNNYLMQDILEHGNGDIHHAVVHELMKDVASLFSHKYGHDVMHACFLKTGESRGKLQERRRPQPPIHAHTYMSSNLLMSAHTSMAYM
ncbi:hypothetical protein ZWY2020_051639 [Hordeum vulgare]|nr:hypothetical protein ZWY2020_051639 [Hordeum vulgare]